MRIAQVAASYCLEGLELAQPSALLGGRNFGLTELGTDRTISHVPDLSPDNAERPVNRVADTQKWWVRTSNGACAWSSSARGCERRSHRDHVGSGWAAVELPACHGHAQDRPRSGRQLHGDRETSAAETATVLSPTRVQRRCGRPEDVVQVVTAIAREESFRDR